MSNERKLGKLIAMAFGKSASQADDLVTQAMPPEPDPTPIDNTGSAEVAQHDQVNAWLLQLKDADPETFEAVRKKPFPELVTLAGA